MAHRKRIGRLAVLGLTLVFMGTPCARAADSVDFQLVRGVHPIVMMTIDGGPPRAMLLDSGTSDTTLPPGAPDKIGKLCFVGGPCANDIRPSSGATPYTIDKPGYINGIVGFDIFRLIPMTIDYPARKIRFKGLERTGEAIAIDYTTDEFGRPFAVTTIEGVKMGPLLLDTGSSFTRVDPKGRKALGRKFQAADAEYSYLMTRTEKTELSSPMRVCVGTACRDDVVVQSASWSALGGTFFNRFRVSFDTARGQVILAPGATDRDPPQSAAKRYGLQLSLTDAGLIVHVRPKSPAAAAGVKAGARIGAIDGTDVAMIGYLGLQQRLESGPAEKRLTINGQPVTLESQ